MCLLLRTVYTRAGVIASLWQVDETATYLLMVQFARQYLDPQGMWSPARTLAQAQRWLRQETSNRVLASYDPLKDTLILSMMPEASQMLYNRTILKLRRQARVQLETAPDACPYADPRYWAAFMVTGY
jgi:CHAT domain-containing protein